MAEINDLTIAFLERHPHDAAMVLQRLPVETAASFLNDVPARLAAPVLARMLPTSAARCIEQLSDDIAAGFLRAMGLQSVSQVLRYLTEPRRRLLQDQFPAGLGLVIGLMLGYPENTVGAWMDPQAPAVPPETTAAEALDRGRNSRAEEPSVLVVVGPDERLQGIVTLPSLLRADGNARMAHIMRPAPGELPARATLASARSHPGWTDAYVLPVVERQSKFVGMLSFGRLSRALLQGPMSFPESEEEGLVEAMAASFWTLCAGLIHAGVASLPQEKSVAKPASPHGRAMDASHEAQGGGMS